MYLVGQIGERIQFMLGQHRQHAVFDQVQRGKLRPQIPHHLIGHTHVLAHEALKRRIDLAAADHLHHRYLQAFLEHFACIGRAHFAADVGCVRHRTGKAHQFALQKYRLGAGDVGQVPGTEPDIVGNQHVAGFQRLHRKLIQKMFDGARHRADERRNTVGGLRQRAPARIRQHTRKVIRFAHDGRERGAHQSRGGFIDDGDEARPQHLQRDSVKFHKYLFLLNN